MSNKVKYLNRDNLPKRGAGEEVSDFHKIVESREWIDTNVLLILETISTSNPEHDSNEKNRAVLARLKAFHELVELPNDLQEKSDPDMDDDLPDAEMASSEPDSYLLDNKQ